MKREELAAEKRTISGKNVKRLRKDGILPANIYGKSFTSLQVQLPLKEFSTIYNKVHETGLIDLKVDGDTLPVLIHNVQVHPATYEPIHADFYKVNLKEKVHTAIPVVPTGEPKAVTDKIGALLQTLNEVEVEALPADLPENFEVNVEPLAAVDEQITVEQLKVPTGVTIITEPSQVVFRIDNLVSEEAEELAAEEEAAAEAASEEAAAETGETTTEEGEKAPEGEAPTEGKKENPQASGDEKSE